MVYGYLISVGKILVEGIEILNSFSFDLYIDKLITTSEVKGKLEGTMKYFFSNLFIIINKRFVEREIRTYIFKCNLNCFY